MPNVSLDDWIGKGVRVWFSRGIGASRQPGATGTVESADQRGVMIGFQMEDAEGHLSQHYRFVPWHMIEYIEPAPS